MRSWTLIASMLGALLVGVPATQGAPATIVAVPVLESTDAGFVAFTFFPDGRIIYAERYTGKIYVFDPNTSQRTLFFTIDKVEDGPERGVLGLAVHPKYPRKPYLFVYATRTLNDGNTYKQILRITDSGGVGTSVKQIWRGSILSNIAHNGGRLLFGPDRALYVVVGDAVNPANSQDLTNDAGKIHRMNDRGLPAPGDPFTGSTIWSYGHRNSFGFAFDPLTGNLWEAENGPDCNDEWNLIMPGQNYGWGPLSDANLCTSPPDPPLNTNQDGPNPVLPVEWFTPTTAPVGTTFCHGCGLTDSEGTLFVAQFNRADIQRAVLTPDRTGIESFTTVYQHTTFSVISMESAPDGTIYFNDFGTLYKLVEA